MSTMKGDAEWTNIYARHADTYTILPMETRNTDNRQALHSKTYPMTGFARNAVYPKATSKRSLSNG
jgi:hypothetical protein